MDDKFIFLPQGMSFCTYQWLLLPSAQQTMIVHVLTKGKKILHQNN